MAKTETADERTKREAEEAAEKARRAAELPLIQECQSALAPLAQMQTPDPSRDPAGHSVPEVWSFNRCGRIATITKADIEEARACIADPTVDLARCRKALGPLGNMPDDFRVTDPQTPIYSPRGQDGRYYGITNAIIRRARAAAGL